MESNTDDGDPIVRAKHLLEDGVRHYQSGGFTEALELWQQAQSLFSKPGLTDLAEADALKADLAMCGFRKNRTAFSLSPGHPFQ